MQQQSEYPQQALDLTVKRRKTGCGQIQDSSQEHHPSTFLLNSRISSSSSSMCDSRDTGDISRELILLEQRQCEELETITFHDPITHIYNPLRYASDPHCRYVCRYGNSIKQYLFLGMNPGPFGMAQTGVPFGQVNLVKTWLDIEGVVMKPPKEHPQRQIQGFDCRRSEVSGQRFWNLFKDVCGTPDVFFRHCFVHNYCPLIFMSESGKNVTPPSISIVERKELERICDKYLCETVKLFQTKTVIAIGRYTCDRAKGALKREGVDHVNVEFLMHPSPINPAANKGWNDIVRKKLEELNIMRLLCHQ